MSKQDMQTVMFRCIEAFPIVFELHDGFLYEGSVGWKQKYAAFDPEPLVFLLCEACELNNVEDVLQINDIEPTWTTCYPTSYKRGILNAVWELFVKHKYTIEGTE